jgi:biopolymer transport protein ExbD
VNFRPRKNTDVEMNVTSFIDVVLLLLIFFMVSTTFGRKSEISITLPESAAVKLVTEPATVNISLDAKGRVFINDNPLVNSQLTTVREALRQASSKLQDPVVIISADAETTHQSVVRVMDAARQLSLTRITFATRVLEQSDADQP